ncbi:peptidase [Sphaerisporangium rufum]|uniref:Peptidase n=1 Tax=Sphaerisporangium rufum TaxID=1381558 RepID=A0A919R8S0_9ACTN|nr:alpha/beta hydrolase [Sphaerisporangium rufum]GII80275.1 peptidase [Sphaerisporangium rufum]
MTVPASQVSGLAAGVPFVAVPPSAVPPREAPVVVTWHLLDAPRTESAMAAALPMAGLPAWRVHLGLPMCGSRMPPGGWDEVMARAFDDAVLKLHSPIAVQAAEEFPAALAHLRKELDLAGGPLGLVGGSLGAAVAQLVAIETGPSAGLEVAAAVLVSPVVRLHDVVTAMGRHFGTGYTWSEEARAAAARLDFLARAGELAAAGQPAIRLVVGTEDDAEGFLEPARLLRDELAARYADPARVDLHTVAGMGHAIAEEPGMAPAPQTPHAAEVERLAAAWLRAHLPGAAGAVA